MRAAFYKATRPFPQSVYSWLVRTIDRGPYSHCELVFGDGMSASASFIDGGVRFKQIDYDAAHWDFVDLPQDNEAAARAWFDQHRGDRYDLVGNLRFVMPWLEDGRTKWFCSEAIAAALGLVEPWRHGPCGLHAELTGKAHR